MAGSQPTQLETINAALELLERTDLGRSRGGRRPLFVDLGAGDGRVVFAVDQRFGCEAIGVDVLQESVVKAEALAVAALPKDLVRRVHFVWADMADVDLSEVDVLFMFLPDAMSRQVILTLLPRSGLREGALVLVADGPADLRHLPGVRHLMRGGAKPTSSRNPPLDLFEWRAAEATARLAPAASSLYFTAPGGRPLVTLRSGGGSTWANT